MSEVIGNIQDPIVAVSQCLLEITEYDEALREALVDAALVVITPIVKMDYKPWLINDDTFRRTHFMSWTKHRPAHNKAVLRLFRDVAEHGLEYVVNTEDSSVGRTLARALEPIFRQAINPCRS